MLDLIKSIVESLDGKNIELYEFLPYILQDLKEIGSSPESIIALIEKHNLIKDRSVKVLDLGCGKGAVSIPIAKKFGTKVHGIDAMPTFINNANSYAKRNNVADLCEFEVNDIRKCLETLSDYHLVILGSIGPVLGNIEQTINQVKECVSPNGFILLDDAYITEKSDIKLDHYLLRSENLEMIKRSGVEIVDEYKFNTADIKEFDKEIFEHVSFRLDELSKKHPENKSLFEDYRKSQEVENEVLENHVQCVTWLLKKN